mmetsp:Transcript_7650/g.12858  ORF Transcript_7650/g.12858 Transcript_7650/m.12858 type:complete len:171 (-) Transcript_7650:147-659(-)
MRIVFEEICFMNRLTVDQVLRYQRFLNKRIRDISHTVDSHFEFIKPSLIKEHKDRFERLNKKRKKEGKEGSLQEQLQRKVEEQEFLKNFERQMEDIKRFPHGLRLEKLVQYQEDLINADKSRTENRRGIQEICRMTGTRSQSYFIFDSQQYSVARKMYFSLEEEKRALIR